MGNARSALGVAVALALTFFSAFAQEYAPPPLEPLDDIPEAISFLSPLLVPKIFQDDWLLKEYIRSDEFAALRSQYGDLHAVDAIFNRAMHLCWNNIYESLLLSCVGTMDHSRVGVRLPVVGPLLWFPLTSEDDETYRDRVSRLPSLLYPDSPKGGIGDRDKLQHFFGSAFLAYVCESREAADRVGDFVEWGEERFIVDGVADGRDIRVNRQGQQFGLTLLDDRSARPSEFMRFVLATLHPEATCEQKAAERYKVLDDGEEVR